jgi:hypothetical protein
MLFLPLFFIIKNSYSQDNLVTLRHNFNIKLIKASKKKTDTEQINEKDLYISTYLGCFDDLEKEPIYLVNSTYEYTNFSSKIAENHTFVYDKYFKFIGYYYYGHKEELPFKFEKNKLFFNCVDGSIISVDVLQEIPKFINIGCNGKSNFIEFLEPRPHERN